MIQKTNGEYAYFAASNSMAGFYSYYGQCFDHSSIGRVFAVKGGPGTGKSCFLRAVADYAAKRGWSAEYVYCSSDPRSLDGVILEKGGARTALLDATAPHVYEPAHPGVREELVNLGEFWSVDALTARAEEIERESLAKSAAYRRAYRYLCGAGETERARRELTAPFIRLCAIERFAKRLTASAGVGGGFEARPALIRSLGMRGEVGFDTYFSNAKRLYLIEDCHGAAAYLLAALVERCAAQGLLVRVSYDPVFFEELDGVFLEESGLAFVRASAGECAYPHRRISVRRFVDTVRMRGQKKRILYATRTGRALLEGAKEALAEAEEHHFALEEIYSAAMDFEKKEAFTKSFCERYFGLQNE